MILLCIQGNSAHIEHVPGRTIAGAIEDAVDQEALPCVPRQFDGATFMVHHDGGETFACPGSYVLQDGDVIAFGCESDETVGTNGHLATS